jgi:hypothetical protein
LQAHLGSQWRIDLDQSMGSGQDADQGVREWSLGRSLMVF